MSDDKSRVDKLNENLNSRTRYEGLEDHRSPLKEGEATNVTENWNSLSIDEMLKKDRRAPQHHSTLHKVFYVALIFFISAMAVAGFIFFKGGNYISSKNVDIKVLAPVSVNAGEIIELGITVENRNNADLESATLYVQYPEGTRDPEDSTLPLTRDREVLGEIKAGREATYTLQTILFGERGETKQIRFTVEYKVKGSNATFSKEKIYDIAIGNTPVSLNLSVPDSVTSGDTFTTTLSILANSSEILKNVIIRGEYPYGFSVIDSAPQARTGNNNVWVIGDLSPGSEKTITITGRLTGQDEEERTFRFYAGVATGEDINVFSTPLAFISETLPIKRPGIGLDVKLNSGNSENAVAPAGKNISANIEYRNNLTNNLTNVRISAKLSGAYLDKATVFPLGNGFYDSNTNTVIWDRSTDPVFENLAPGTRGVVSLNFASRAEGIPGSSNQEIKIDVTISGVPQGSQNTFSVTESRFVKIASEINLAARSLYSRGPFKNTGPIPPHAEEETTYTIVLNARNTQNDITNAKVTAILGSNVRWLSETSPAAEISSFDEGRKMVTWNIDTLKSGSGFDAVGREFSFRVGLTPSLGQINGAPVLATNITFTGVDAFTGEQITTSAEAVTTRTSTDPSYIQGNEIVTK